MGTALLAGKSSSNSGSRTSTSSAHDELVVVSWAARPPLLLVSGWPEG